MLKIIVKVKMIIIPMMMMIHPHNLVAQLIKDQGGGEENIRFYRIVNYCFKLNLYIIYCNIL